MRKAARYKPIPPVVLHRMALYHCLLTDWLLAGKDGSVTSKELADSLGLTEGTIRNDLSYLGDGAGVRGVGYSIGSLKQQIGDYLMLPPTAPVAFVGSVKFAEPLLELLSDEKFGFFVAAFFSDNPSDRGVIVNGREVQSMEAISPALGDLGIRVAVIATRTTWVQRSINLLAKAGIKGMLLLTPVTEIKVPEGVNVAQTRIPCDLKTLVYSANLAEEEEQGPTIRTLGSDAAERFASIL